MGTPRWMKKLSRCASDITLLVKRQGELAKEASFIVREMFAVTDIEKWKQMGLSVKHCQDQAESARCSICEEIIDCHLSANGKMDLETFARYMSDYISKIYSSARSLVMFKPKNIDNYLTDMVNCLVSESEAILRMVSSVTNGNHEIDPIIRECDRINEIELECNDAFGNYIADLFGTQSEPVDIMRYKNICEVLEGASDAAKKVADHARQMVLRYSN